jgi:hypothetical protein
MLIRGILCFVCFLIILPAAYADIVVRPPGLDQILQKITEQQHQEGDAAPNLAEIVFKDNQIAFIQHSDKVEATVNFSAQVSTIVKNFRLKSENEEYKFTVILKQQGAPFAPLVEKIAGADALIFFNDTEVFVYTQCLNQDQFDLREWIYALKPNAVSGSIWEWSFISVPWEWPLTLEMSAPGQVVLNRNIPFAGIPISRQAKDNYMLPMMLKFQAGDRIEKYFPFKEKVGSISPAQAWNKEGRVRPVDTNVFNSLIIKDEPIKKGPGFNFAAWEERWKSIYTVAVKAADDEYPLLIGVSEE